MSTQKIAASTLWQLGSQITMAALSIITVKFVAMGLSKELAGNYNSAYGYLQLFGILADFGLYAVAVREVSAAKDKARVLGGLIILRALILCFSLAVALLFVWILPVWKGTPLPLSVTIASLVPLFTLLAGILRTVFQVQYKMQYVFVAEVTQRVVGVFLIGFFVLQGVRKSTDLHVLHLFLFFGGVAAFVLFALSFVFADRLITVRPRWDGTLIKELARKALPYGLAFLCVALYRQFDISLIAILRPDYEIQNAYYGFVLRMMDMAYLLPTFLLNSTLPILSERNANGKPTKDVLGKVFFMILVLGSVSALFAVFWARPLMQLLTTDSYLSTETQPGSDSALALLALPMFFNGLVTFCFYALLTRHFWKPLLRNLLVGVAASLTLNLWLIPEWGFVGAAVTSIVVHALLVFLLLPESARAMPMRLTGPLVFQWILFASLLAAFLTLTRPLLVSPAITAAMLITSALWMGVSAWVAGMHRLFKA